MRPYASPPPVRCAFFFLKEKESKRTLAQNFVLLDFSFRFFSRAAQVCRPYKGGRNLIPYPTRATARVAPTTFPHKYTERRAGSSRPTGGAEPSGSPQEPVPDRPAGSRLTFRDTAGGASPSPTGFKKIFSVWAGEALGAPARIRTGNVCSAKPGAVAEPHQRKFLQIQGPVAREEFRCPLRFCAPEILLHLSGTRPP